MLMTSNFVRKPPANADVFADACTQTFYTISADDKPEFQCSEAAS